VPTLAVGLAFGNVGQQSFAGGQALRGFLTCLGVAGLCWRRQVVRWAALPEPGEYVVRAHWSRYLSASSGCVRPAEGGWSAVVVEHPGTVKIEGGLTPRQY
jgi:hypothetical protein